METRFAILSLDNDSRPKNMVLQLHSESILLLAGQQFLFLSTSWWARYRLFFSYGYFLLHICPLRVS